MEKCYYCECELNEENKSLEHIIPNALYGKLKSRDILCKKCNNGLSRVDVKLVDSFMLFVNLVDGKTDRKTKKDLKVKVNGEDATLKPNMEFHSDIQIENNGNGEIVFKTFFSEGNKKARQYALKQIQSRLKSQYAIDVSIEELEQNIETRHEPAYIQTSLGKEVCKALEFRDYLLPYLKISLGFCALKSKIHDIQKEVLDIFRNLDSFDIDKFIKFVRLPDLIDDDKILDGRLCHHIYLIGDSFNSKMFCIVSLFNCLNVVIVLNEEYNGDDFQESYVFDVIRNQEIHKKTSLCFDEIAEKQFDINKITENERSRNNGALEFFKALNIYCGIIHDKLIQLYDYACFKNMHELSKGEFIDFMRASLEKAAENRLLILNKYFLYALAIVEFQNILYNEYRQRRLYVQHFFESDEYRQYLDNIQKASGLSGDKVREFFLHNISNEWVRILG